MEYEVFRTTGLYRMADCKGHPDDSEHVIVRYQH